MLYLTTIVDCGPPSVPRNGSLESYTITTEGSVVFYSCDLGLVPEGRMRAVCAENGWSPNPADLNCFSSTCILDNNIHHTQATSVVYLIAHQILCLISPLKFQVTKC